MGACASPSNGNRRTVGEQDGQPVYEYVESQLAYVTVRTDSGRELGAVGPDYTPVQNVDAFAAFEPLFDAGLLTLETGGVLRDGADAWLCARFDIEKFGPVAREVFARELTPYAVINCNHSGRRKTSLSLTAVREVCANTQALIEARQDAGLDKFVAVRHTGDAARRLSEAAAGLFAGIVSQFETIAAQYGLLKATFLSAEEFRRLVVAPAITDPRTKRGWNPDALLANSVVQRYERKVSAVTDLWTEGRGHTKDHSAWEAYQGLIEAIDHHPDLFPSRAGSYRTASLLHGTLGQIKTTVLDTLVAHAVRRQSMN